MRWFLSSRWLVWCVGAVLGLWFQLPSLAHAGGLMATLKVLGAGFLAGLLSMGLLFEALGLAGRYFGWRLWDHGQRLGNWLGRTAWTLTGLGSRGGRHNWLMTLAAGLLIACLPTYHYLLKPAQGASLVRQYFVQNQEPAGAAGLRALQYQGLDQAGPVRDLGVINQWDYGNLEAMPGDHKEFFVLRGLGVIDVPKTGIYGFGGRVDDAMLLLIDGRAVVDNQYEGPPKDAWGKVYLTAGLHSIDFSFMQYSGGACLILQWQPPGQDRQPLGKASLRPLKANTPLAPVTRLRLEHGLVPKPFSTYDPWQSGRFWDLPW